MIIVVKPKFRRDVGKINKREVLEALKNKLQQISVAPEIIHVTGTILLRSYSHHYRIQVKTGKHSYRIGAIVRGNKIWLVRFLPRKIIYTEFP